MDHCILPHGYVGHLSKTNGEAFANGCLNATFTDRLRQLVSQKLASNHSLNLKYLFPKRPSIVVYTAF